MSPYSFKATSTSRIRYRVRAKFILLVIMTSVLGCNSDSSTKGLDTMVSDVYYIRTTTDSGPVYLSASRLYGPQHAGGENLQSIPIENAAIAWKIEGEETLTIRSQSQLIKPLSNLVVHANDGLMQIAIVDDSESSSVFANWRLIPLDNGFCHLINVDLGNELALSVVNSVLLPDGSSRYSVEMVGIDNALDQEWTIVRIGDPPGQFEQICIEKLE